jgi:hypothetical protein
MMISKCIALLVAAPMLANCCALGNGCAPESGAPIAWDGLGSAPTDDAQSVEPPPKKHVRAKREIIVGPLDAAADQDDEARLKRKLMICSNCGATESARDNAAGSVSH